MRGTKYIGILVMMLVCHTLQARKFSVSTNVLNYVNLVTLNAEGSYAVAQHWSITAGVKYNPFTFSVSGHQVQNRQQAYSVGARFWPWHIYSGWWVAAKAQYQEYNSGGILSLTTEEGDRWGAGVTAGYTYMIHHSLNIEFGLGFWAGIKKYTVYGCPSCGLTTETGSKGFILPNDLIIGISYVF